MKAIGRPDHRAYIAYGCRVSTPHHRTSFGTIKGALTDKLIDGLITNEKMDELLLK